jgi:hypothetical protein
LVNSQVRTDKQRPEGELLDEGLDYGEDTDEVVDPGSERSCVRAVRGVVSEVVDGRDSAEEVLGVKLGGGSPVNAEAFVGVDDVELVWVDAGEVPVSYARRGPEVLLVDVGGKVFLVVVVVLVAVRVEAGGARIWDKREVVDEGLNRSRISSWTRRVMTRVARRGQ